MRLRLMAAELVSSAGGTTHHPARICAHTSREGGVRGRYLPVELAEHVLGEHVCVDVGTEIDLERCALKIAYCCSVR